MKKKWYQRKKGKLIDRLEMGMMAVIVGLLCVLVVMVIAIKVRGTAGDQAQGAAAQAEGEASDQPGQAETSPGESQDAAGEEDGLYLGPREGNGYEPMTEEEKAAWEEKRRVRASFTVSAAGDCTLGTDEHFSKNTSFVAKYDEVQDPSYFFAGVQSVFGQDDLTIVNLEGTFTELTSRADKQYAFKGDPSYVEILTSGSVEAVNVANNHSKDYGTESYYDTLDVLRGAGVKYFGYGTTLLMEVNGIQVGMLGTYELAQGIECKEDLLAGLQSLKDQGAQVIIASFHWGVEREHYPTDVQVELAHLAIDNGADLVLGHHPHVLQGIEKYKGKYIAYSLGNFCFGGNKNPSDKDTMIFQQTFTLKDGELQVDDNIEVIPCTLSSTDARNDYQPTLAEGERADEILERIQEYSSELGTENQAA